MIRDPNQPDNSLFSLPRSGGRRRKHQADTERLSESFYPQTAWILNEAIYNSITLHCDCTWCDHTWRINSIDWLLVFLFHSVGSFVWLFACHKEFLRPDWLNLTERENFLLFFLYSKSTLQLRRHMSLSVWRGGDVFTAVNQQDLSSDCSTLVGRWSLMICFWRCACVHVRPRSDPRNLWRLQPGLPGFLRLHRPVELPLPHPGRDLQCQPAHEALQKVFLAQSHFSAELPLIVFMSVKIQFIEATLTFAFICCCASSSVEQKNVLNWAVTPASAAESLALDGKVCFVQQTVFTGSRVHSVQQLSSMFPHIQSFRSSLLVPFSAKTNRYLVLFHALPSLS